MDFEPDDTFYDDLIDEELPIPPPKSTILPSAALTKLVENLPGGGEVREGQLRMADAVGEGMNAGKHRVIQAGTGTGKSLGYLVPAILSGQRTLVLTATKALQDQLAKKDLPFLQARLEDIDFTYAVLKGRDNYVCMQRVHEIHERGTGPQQGTLDGVAAEDEADGVDPAEMDALLAWAETTTTGDRAELPLEPSREAWRALTVSSVACPGAANCEKGSECFAEQAKSRAQEADIVVANMHLWGADIALEGRLLPWHTTVIVDECHEVEDILAASLGTSLTPARVRNAASDVKRIVEDDALIKAIRAAAKGLETALNRHTGQRLPNGAEGDVLAALNEVAHTIGRAQIAVKRVEQAASAQAKSRAIRVKRVLANVAAEIKTLIGTDGTYTVMWVEDGPHLKTAPVEVGSLLKDSVWANTTGILTSATVPPGIARRLGMPTDTPEMNVGSPFDYRRQSCLYVPEGVGDPRTDGWRERAHAEMLRLINAAGGRTMALFTSYREMNAAAEFLRANLDTPVFVQGDMPKPVLVDQFAEDESSVLVATSSFWTGVDVPGRTCSLVIIDRIPFPSPVDPLWMARRERAGEGAFFSIDVPRAAAVLAQGAGRLIRSANCEGVVCVMDSRLAESRYRKQLLKSLPPMPRTRNRDEVMGHLARIAQSAKAPAA